MDQEIEFTNTYLDLEQARFGDRLLVHEDVERGGRSRSASPRS